LVTVREHRPAVYPGRVVGGACLSVDRGDVTDLRRAAGSVSDAVYRLHRAAQERLAIAQERANHPTSPALRHAVTTEHPAPHEVRVVRGPGALLRSGIRVLGVARAGLVRFVLPIIGKRIGASLRHDRYPVAL